MTTDSGFENGARVPVASYDFDFLKVESPEFKAHVEAEVQLRLFDAQLEAVNKLLHILIAGKNPLRIAYQLAYACGMGALCQGSASSIARKFGLSRQAFEQEGARLLISLHMRKNPLEKSPQAAEKYKTTNIRLNKV